MDSISQAALGAVIGQSATAKALGRRALLFGAIAGTIPDLDGIVINLMDGDAFDQWVHHRGITHSLFFGPIMGLLLGELTWRYYGWRDRRRVAQQKEPLGLGTADKRRPWIILWILALFTHPLLDFTTTYGTQLLAPFSDHRFAYDAMSIVDPVYTVPLLLSVVLGLFLGRDKSRKVATGFLALTCAYIGFCGWMKFSVEREAARQLAAANVEYQDLDAHATLFQGAYRRVVVSQDDGYLVGYYTYWSPTHIDWKQYRQQSHPAIATVNMTREGQIADWFSSDKNYKFVRPSADGGYEVVFRDMRYGLPMGGDEGLFGIKADVGLDLTLKVKPEPTRPKLAERGGGISELFSQMYRLAFPS